MKKNFKKNILHILYQENYLKELSTIYFKMNFIFRKVKKTYEKKFKNLGENFAIVNPHSKDSYTKVKGWGI